VGGETVKVTASVGAEVPAAQLNRPRIATDFSARLSPPHVRRSAYRDPALPLAVASNYSQFGARVAISPLVLTLVGVFAVSKGTIGLVLGGMWAAFAITQYPGGLLADRFGERRVILVSLAGTAAGSALVALSPSIYTFAAAAIAMGAAAGLYFPVGTSLLSKRFDEPGIALGAHSAGAMLAGMTVPVAVTLVAGRFGWRAAILVGAALTATATVLVLVVLDPTPPARPELSLRKHLTPTSALVLLSRPSVAFTTVLGVAGMYTFQAYVSFFPAFLEEYHGLASTTASTYFGGLFLLSSLSLPLFGRLYDRYSDLGLAIPFLALVSGLGAVLVVPDGPAILFALLVVGLGGGWGGALQVRFAECFEDGERGAGLGVVRTTYVLCGSVGNAATGFLADAVGWPVAIGAMAGVAGLALGLLAINHALDLGL
jgi:MFS family permease